MTDKDYTHIAMVVDRSGSMQGIHTDMNGAILRLLKDQSSEPGYCVVDITTFDDKIEHPYVGVRPDDVKGEVIVPRGSTALNDAIGYTVVELGVRFSAMPEEDRPGTVIIVVVTDGMENASREYTAEQVKALIEHQSINYGWTFMYLAANVDAFATGGGYGFDRAHTISVAGTGQSWEASYAATSASITRTRKGDSTGYLQAERDAASGE